MWMHKRSKGEGISAQLICLESGRAIFIHKDEREAGWQLRNQLNPLQYNVMEVYYDEGDAKKGFDSIYKALQARNLIEDLTI